MKYLLTLVIVLLFVFPVKAKNYTLFFVGESCSHCKKMEPLVDKEKNKGTKIVKVDVDKRPKLADFFRVRKLPTFITFQEGAKGEKDTEVKRETGEISAKELHSLCLATPKEKK